MKHALWQPIASFIIWFAILSYWSWRRPVQDNSDLIFYVGLGVLHDEWFRFVRWVNGHNKA